MSQLEQQPSDEEGGQAILARLSAINMSQADLARAMRVAPTTVSRWINGVTPVSPEMRPRLAVALELSEAELAALLPAPGRRARAPLPLADASAAQAVTGEPSNADADIALSFIRRIGNAVQHAIEDHETRCHG